MFSRVFLATFLSACPGLYASITFTDFSGGTYNTGVSLITADIAAQQFTPTITGNLLSLTFALGVSQLSTPPNIADVFLYADNAGIPGTLLESLSFDVGSFHNPAFEPAALIVTVNSITNPLLTAGQIYWAGIQSFDNANHPIIWYFGFGSDPGIDIFFQGAWVPESPTPTFPLSLEVQVGTVPEPGSLALLAAGMAGIVLRRKFSRRAP